MIRDCLEFVLEYDFVGWGGLLIEIDEEKTAPTIDSRFPFASSTVSISN